MREDDQGQGAFRVFFFFLEHLTESRIVKLKHFNKNLLTQRSKWTKRQFVGRFENSNVARATNIIQVLKSNSQIVKLLPKQFTLNMKTKYLLIVCRHGKIRLKKGNRNRQNKKLSLVVNTIPLRKISHIFSVLRAFRHLLFRGKLLNLVKKHITHKFNKPTFYLQQCNM